ncbi:Sensor histidine kinase RcsC [Vibrio stylophorae]|uniref:histidine kinase n=1 Tax=Vibrio stylophorae TaxID=659351 RepID=A0ABN8DN81_9VIBR|nr:ATP-binding protein [Vibrio stylophorae]CAH0532581.1 Sensor histidine kinase RcsC [Vibrio stylophorae]
MQTTKRFKRLQHALMLAFLALSITPLVLTGLFFLNSHSRDLENQSQGHLASLRDSKVKQINRYFEAEVSNVQGFSRSDLAVGSGGRFYGLVSAFAQLGFSKDRALNAITNQVAANLDGNQAEPDSTRPISPSLVNTSERYRLLHKRYHQSYLDFLNRSDFSDILLVDVDGNVVYSVKKRNNYGMNLTSAAYKDKPLGQAFQQIQKASQGRIDANNIPVILTDFSTNNSHDVPVAWLAAPVSQDNYLHSYVFFELPNTVLTELVQEDVNNQANSTHALLINQAHHTRINMGAENDKLFESPAIDLALAGDTGVGRLDNFDGIAVLSAFAPIHVLDKHWALVIELPTNEAFARVRQLETIFIIAMLSAIILVVIASHWLSNSITAPLLRLTWAAERVSAGDLDQAISSTDRHDEIGRLAISFERMQRSVREKIATIRSQNQELEHQIQIIEEKNAELEHADKLKDEFLAMTSHELRTPLHGMVGIAESMVSGLNGPLPLQQQHQLQMIINSGQRLSNLVDDILDYHKMRYGNVDLDSHALDSSVAVRLVLEMSNHLLGDKPVRIINQVGPNLPLIFADEQRLEQVLYNLVGNAIKYTSEGKIIISATVLDHQLRIQVVDTGEGIPADQLELIFEPLTQTSDSSRYRQGAGLGLSISRQLIELMNGQLYVSSQPLIGTTFSFTLPLATEAQVSTSKARDLHNHFQAPSAADNQLLDESEQLPENPNGDMLLVIDDEPVNLQILNNYLRLEGYRVITADNGMNALELVQTYHPVLVLTDVMMPGMNGYEVTETLRQHYNPIELPIIMLTALSQIHDRIRGFESGANDYLTKPFSKEELSARIRAHLRASQSEVQRQENARLQAEIRHRQQVEAGLLETQSRLLNLLESASEPVLCIQADDRIRYANDAAGKLFKRASEQLERLHFNDLLSVPLPHSAMESHHYSGAISVKIGEEIHSIKVDMIKLPEESGLNAMLVFNTGETAAHVRIDILESAIELLSDYAFHSDDDKLQQLRELGGEFTRLADRLGGQQTQKGDLMRECLVEATLLSLEYWETCTGSNKFALAEESGLWRVYLDRSTLQTRTLDKYLRKETLPKTPRWRTVLNTVDFVLERGHQHTDLRQRLQQARDRLQRLMMSQV